MHYFQPFPCNSAHAPSLIGLRSMHASPVYRSRTATPLNSGARDLGHEGGGASAAGRLTKPLTPLGYGDLYVLCNKFFHVASAPFCWLRRDSKRSNERRSQCFSSTALSLFNVKRSPSFPPSVQRHHAQSLDRLLSNSLLCTCVN